jgi:hypothetical protein
VAPAHTDIRHTLGRYFFQNSGGIRPIIFFKTGGIRVLEPNQSECLEIDCEETVAGTRGNGEVAP